MGHRHMQSGTIAIDKWPLLHSSPSALYRWRKDFQGRNKPAKRWFSLFSSKIGPLSSRWGCRRAPGYFEIWSMSTISWSSGPESRIRRLKSRRSTLGRKVRNFRACILRLEGCQGYGQGKLTRRCLELWKGCELGCLRDLLTQTLQAGISCWPQSSCTGPDSPRRSPLASCLGGMAKGRHTLSLSFLEC